jgi:NAD(P)-dependent dehydrogenase (short-subunit alcohol dehydrogenase family)
MLQDKLQDSRIIIVGGSSGIGFAVARLSLASGAAKVTIGSSNKERVDSAVQKLKCDLQGTSGQVEGYVVDAKHEDQIQLFFDRIGQFDHLVRVNMIPRYV